MIYHLRPTWLLCFAGGSGACRHNRLQKRPPGVVSGNTITGPTSKRLDVATSVQTARSSTLKVPSLNGNTPSKPAAAPAAHTQIPGAAGTTTAAASTGRRAVVSIADSSTSRQLHRSSKQANTRAAEGDGAGAKRGLQAAAACGTPVARKGPPRSLHSFSSSQGSQQEPAAGATTAAAGSGRPAGMSAGQSRSVLYSSSQQATTGSATEDGAASKLSDTVVAHPKVLGSSSCRGSKQPPAAGAAASNASRPMGGSAGRSSSKHSTTGAATGDVAATKPGSHAAKLSRTAVVHPKVLPMLRPMLNFSSYQGNKQPPAVSAAAANTSRHRKPAGLDVTAGQSSSHRRLVHSNKQGTSGTATTTSLGAASKGGLQAPGGCSTAVLRQVLLGSLQGSSSFQGSKQPAAGAAAATADAGSGRPPGVASGQRSRSPQAAAERRRTDMVCIVQVPGSRLGLDITRFFMVRGQS